MRKSRGLPAVRLVIPFITGIYTGDIAGVTDGAFCALSIGFLVVTMFILELNNSYSFRWVNGFFSYMSLMIAGACLVESDNLLQTKNLEALPSDSTCVFAGRLKGFPRGDSIVKFEVDLEAIQDSGWKKVHGTILIYLENDSTATDLMPDDILIFKCRPEKIPGPANPNAFDYRNYLAHRSVFRRARISHADLCILDGERKFSFRRTAYLIRQRAEDDLNDAIRDKAARSIALAMVLGNRDAIEQELYQKYAGSGAVHILCVSGLHVGILYIMLRYLLAPLFRRKRWKGLAILVIMLVIWYYAMMTGLSPSVTRAAVMFSLINAGQLMKRPQNTYNTLAGSALIILISDPQMLFRVGFQLSYLAVAGIVTFHDRFYNRDKLKWMLPDKLWSLGSVSLSAQLATFPLSIHYFGQFPNFFLLTNIVVVPLTSVVLYLSLFFFITLPIGEANRIAAKGLEYSIDVMNLFIEKVEGMPGSVSTLLDFSAGQVLLLYIMLIILAGVMTRSSPVRWMFFLGTGALLLLISHHTQMKNLNSGKVVFYDMHNRLAIGAQSGRQNCLLTDRPFKNPFELERQVRYCCYGDWRREGRGPPDYIPGFDSVFSHPSGLSVQSGYLEFEGRTFYILSTPGRTGTKVPLKVDYLVILADPGALNDRILAGFRPGMVIISGNLANYKAEEWKDACIKADLPCHSVGLDGAFVISM